MNLKRVLAMVLCLMLVLPCVAAMNVIPEAQAAEQTVRIEAEDTTYAVWNKYTALDTSDVGYSEGGAAGTMQNGTYPAFDIADTTEDLAAGFIDKSNVPYVAFYVDVPVAGTYSLSTASYFKFNATCDNAYAVFLVNPHDPRQETVSYKGYYGKVTGTHYLPTQSVDVTLEEGRNVIYVVSATTDSNIRWANIDYLEITGEHAVSPVNSNAQTLYAGDAPYVYGYETINAGGSIGGGSWGTASLMDTSNGQSVNKTRPISEMSAVNARTLRGFTYTVNAPADGYYDITVSFNSMTAGDDSKAIGFLVDGAAQAREFAFHTGGNKTKGYIDLSVYLTKGDHVLTITAPANRTSAETANNSDWCDYAELLLYGGLTQSVIQSNPNVDYWYAEAEYQTEGYVVWHGFNSEGDTSRAETYRDYNNANYTDYQSANTIGGSNAVNNYTLTQYQEGRLDKTTAAAVTMYVEAEQAGTYSFYARYYLKAPGIWDSTNTAWTTDPFGVFMVNGDFGAQAMFNPLVAGVDRTTGDTDVVELTLKKGLNEITFIPLPKDNWKSTSDWCTMDCIFVDTALQVAKVPTGSVSYTPDKGVVNLYTEQAAADATLPNSMGYDKRTAANYYNVKASTLTKDMLHVVPFVGYTVEAPYDGYYNISLAYNSNGVNAENYAIAVLVDEGTKSEVKHVTGKSGVADVSTYLTKGTHTLAFTLAMPISADHTGTVVWCDQGEITMEGGLVLAETQVNPLHYGMTVLEAENDAFINRHDPDTKLQTSTYASNGFDVGNAYSSSQTVADVKQYLDPSVQPYVEYLVEADTAGEYALLVGVRGKFSVGYKVLVQVNGTVYEQECRFDDNVNCHQPVTVTLEKGLNTVRVLGATSDIGWVNQDCLALPTGLSGQKNSGNLIQESDKLTFMGNYNYKTNDTRYWGEDGLDNSVIASVTLENLSEDNFLNASWYAVTVKAPAAGWYAVQSNVWVPTVETAQLGKLGVLANGTVYEAKLWQDSSAATRAEAFVYLNEGLNDLIFTGILADSNVAAHSNGDNWMDGDYIVLCGGLTLAQTQRYPVEGLVDGSAYSLSGKTVTGVWKDTTVAQLKSNFFGTVAVTSGGAALADTAVVPTGAVVSYASGTAYTVTTYNRGDYNGDGMLDIRDLKYANEQIINGTETDLVSDIIRNQLVELTDVVEYVAIIFGKTDSDLFYQPHSIGADEILVQCNPVGRLLNYRSAVFMESSASGFTLTGDLKGDVTISLRAEEGTSDGGTACIYVEVDGVVSEYPFPVNTDQKLTIATGLTAGSHTIKITKGTDAKYDAIYVYSVSYNGTLQEAEPAAHTIEFLGDSITVGFGLYNESSTMSGSYYSYANVAADLLGADHYTIGNGAWRFGENTGAEGDTRYLGYIYEKNSMNLDLGAYDFTWQPEVIVINLGTNDANQYTFVGADEEGATAESIISANQEVWSADVAALLTMVRAHNPNAKIFWVYGAMEDVTTNATKDVVVPLIQNAVAAYNTASGDNVTYVHVTNDNAGVNDHPTREGHQVIGTEVAEAIAEAMGWDLVD